MNADITFAVVFLPLNIYLLFSFASEGNKEWAIIALFTVLMWSYIGIRGINEMLK